MFGSVDQWDGLGVFFDANTGGKVRSVRCVISGDNRGLVDGTRTFKCGGCTI